MIALTNKSNPNFQEQFIEMRICNGDERETGLSGTRDYSKIHLKNIF